MLDEIFRFVLARPPTVVATDEFTVVHAVPLDAINDPIDFPASVDEARRFLESSEYPKDLSTVSKPLADFSRRAQGEPADADLAVRLLGDPLSEALADPGLRRARLLLAKSLAAASMANAPHHSTQHLTDGIRALTYLERLSAGKPNAHKALSSPVVLPSSTRPAPIPQPPPPIAPDPSKTDETVNLLNDFRTNSRAIKKLPFEKKINERATETDSGSTRGSAVVRRSVAEFDFGDLSGAGQTIVRELVSQDRATLGAVLEELEYRMDLSLVNTVPGVTVPGITLPGGSVLPTSSPSEPVAGHARVAGVGDLLLVRKELARYELGDISHVENLLPGESFSRNHIRVNETEIFESIETEVSEETERELQTTTRSELTEEASETIREELQLSAGATVTYRGPMVEASANANVAYERATEESVSVASKFARDVVDRSVTRFSEKTKSIRSTRRTTRVEDTANRTMSNTTGDDLVGIYRWVDKIDKCQVVNYGRRLLIDTVVPEPGEYTRYRQEDKPKPNLDLKKPASPTFFGSPLYPWHLTRSFYQYYLGQYNVANVNPPPAPLVTLGVAMQQEEPNEDKSSDTILAESAIQTPTGYSLDAVTVEWSGSHTSDSDRFWEIIVSNIEFKSEPPPRGDGVGSTTGGGLMPPPIELGNVEGTVPVSMVAKRYVSFVANIVVTFARTEEAYADWQNATYNAIMNAYERQLAEYNDATESARLEDEQLAREMGTNPLTQQRFVRDEIKRLAIQTMTGRDLGDLGFSVPPTDVAPPTIDRENIQEKTSYIRFVEQAFEWHAMSWVFYPYFWADVSGWADHAFLTSTDADFAQFLRAGAARVVIPVTPGFDNDVLYFLEHGQPWMGGEPPTYDPESDAGSEAPYVPIIEELREQLGYDFESAPGMLEVTASSDLVKPTVWTIEAASPGREILLDTNLYLIQELTDSGHWRLDRVVEGATGMYPFALGPLYVGPSWEVRLPTTLVALTGNQERLTTLDD